jgi:hypothetical protein
MVFDKFINLSNPRVEKSVVGLTKVQFLKISEFFDKTYHEIQNERLINGQIRRLPKGGSSGVLDTPQKMLFFILYYMKTYCTFDFLGFTFGFSSGHVHDYIKRIFPVLKKRSWHWTYCLYALFHPLKNWCNLLKNMRKLYSMALSVLA